ncbi:AraC family transcriptional regulator [Fundicoccus sp. Sow4_H7]|uniref:AraC family transcriptional regulator n=1 Tax=Fundicoccus sp. Sow4_H7 TaxID=3438784 RepID=UPI003F905F06
MLYYTDYESNTTDLKVEFYGYEDCQPNQSFGPEVRELFVLHFIEKGSGKFYCDNQVHSLKQGDLFLLKPGVETYYQADDEEPWSYFWIGLSGNKSMNYLQQSTLYIENILTNISKKDAVKFEEIFRGIIDLMGLNNFNTYYHLSLFEKTYSLLSLLIAVSARDELNNLSQKRTYAIQAKNYIDAHYAKDIRINELAETMALNRSYLTRIFKEEYDISPKNYLTQVRMEKAKQLLVDTDWLITKISQTVGYNDVLAFSSSFKTYTDVSPTEYRETYEQYHHSIIRRKNE